MSITNTVIKNMERTFHHKYHLKKDTPTYKKGWPLGWDGKRRAFFFSKPSKWGFDNGKPDIYLDYEGPKYSVDEVQDTEWFEPVGREVPFIPSFPSEKKLEEYMYLIPETRLVDDVDECRAISMLLNDKEFQKRLYQFYKEQYEAFHSL